jgi:hypothetical protein
MRHLCLLRFAPRCRGQPEDAMNRNSVAAAGMVQRQKGRRRRKRARPCGRAPSVFRHAGSGWQDDASSATGAATYAVIDGETLLQKLSAYSRGNLNFATIVAHRTDVPLRHAWRHSQRPDGRIPGVPSGFTTAVPPRRRPEYVGGDAVAHTRTALELPSAAFDRNTPVRALRGTPISKVALLPHYC